MNGAGAAKVATCAGLAALGCMGASEAGSLARLTEKLPDPPTPAQTETTWAARSMRVNGLPMTLQAFESRLSPDALFTHYESWSRTLGNAATKRMHMADGELLGVSTPCCQITIQVQRTASGSAGTITVSPALERASLKVISRFPRPTTTRLVNLQEYEDDGVEAEHLALESARSVLVEQRAFERVLVENGWSIVRSQPALKTRGAHVMAAQKGAQHAQLTFLPDQTRAGATAIVVVWRKS